MINPKGEFHSDPRISMARAELKKRRKKDAGCNEHGTIDAISSDFGDRMTTQHLD